MIVDPPTDDPEIPEGCCGLAPNKVMTPIEKYDFYVPLDPEVRDNTKHDVPLPASFLQIKEGEVDKGRPHVSLQRRAPARIIMGYNGTRS
jgi:hypothetical protein